MGKFIELIDDLKLADKVFPLSLDFYRAHTHICTIKIQRRSNLDTTPLSPLGIEIQKPRKKWIY